MKQIKDLVHEISEKINSNQNAWYIIEAITKKSKAQLLLSDKIDLSSQELDQINEWIRLHVNEHMPIQYLLGYVPFIDCKIFVNPPILIPRVETEFWCSELINKLKQLENTRINILDIGTGSGCIAIAIAKAFPSATVYAVDISDEAICLAKKNVKLNNVNNVLVIKSNLFENLGNIKFDLIVSNPPYINEKYFDKLDLSVKKWEDRNALISADEGLYLIKSIINGTKKFLNINSEFKEKEIPQLVLEIDSMQGKEVSEYLNKNDFLNIKIEKDLAKRDRFITAGR